MRLVPKGLSIRYYISALLIAVSALGLVLAWGIYRRASEPDLPPPAEVSEPEGGASLSELEHIFQDQSGDPSRYGVIVDKNLFSEHRRAAADEAAPQAGPQGVAADRGQEVQLLGTSILGERKSAVLRFPRFQGRDKVRIAEEGQTVRDEPLPGSGAGSRQSYTVTAIEQRRVTLTDQSGQSFTVGLAEPSPAGKQPQDQEGIQDEGQVNGERIPRMQPEEDDGTMQGFGSRQPTRREARQGRNGQGRQGGEGANGQVSPPTPARDADNTGAGTWSQVQ